MNVFAIPDADSSCGLYHSGEMQLLLEWEPNGKNCVQKVPEAHSWQ